MNNQVETKTDLTVATEILKQLGGRHFIAMTGCKNLFAENNGLKMKLGRNTSGAQYLFITLNGLDLYDMQFLSIKKDGQRIIRKECNNLYFDMLQTTFTEVTGLYTHL